MIKKYTADFPGSKIYFTEADPSAQNFYLISPDDFNIKIKLWLLLSDHTILSVGHLLQSSITYNWVIENAKVLCELSDDNPILPSLREDRETFKEFVTRDPGQEDQPSVLLSQKDTLLKRAQALEDIFQTAITWPPVGESHWFRDALVKDLLEKNTPLRKRIIGVPIRVIDQLAKDIASCEFLNRETLTHVVRKHCPERERLLLRYGDIYYHLSGALFKDAFPVFHPEAAGLCREKISHAVRHSSVGPSRKGDIWHEIIDTWGITHMALQELPLSEIIGIRRDPLGIRLRQTWHNLMEQSRRSQIEQQNIFAFQQAKDRIIDLFKHEVSLQKKRYARSQKVRETLEVGSWVTGGFSALAGFFVTSDPLFSTVAGLLGLLAGKPILDSVQKRLPKAELIILAASIEHRSI